jgi:hypothetical protein
MTAQDVVVATMTWARDEAEARMLQAALRTLGSQALTVVATDGGSSEGFLERLNGISGLVLRRSSAPGLVRQVKSSIAAALDAGAEAVLYTEPDKDWFFRHGVIRLIECWRGAPQPSLVLAARSPASFATFPPFQRRTEGLVNDLCERLIGRRGDYSYGPFLMDRALAARVLAMPDNLGWGWRTCLFGLAARLGYSLSWHTGDFPCPEDQRSEGFGDQLHRLKQLQENSDGLLWAAVSPLDPDLSITVRFGETARRIPR